MKDISSMAKQWIDQEKDPRSAHWQAGLEAIMELFIPDMEKGRLIPVRGMTREETPLFESALKLMDLSPSVFAAFLSSSVANALVPPDTAPELVRIEKPYSSCKIIILNPGEENRILCAEISPSAHTPGIDIFQSGALLGTYNYENTEDCMEGLKKAAKAHVWKKETWQPSEYLTYTLNWFDRVRHLNSADVNVDKNVSFFHTPTRIKMSRVDGLFHLIYHVLEKEYAAPEFFSANQELVQRIKEKDNNACRMVAQTHILDLLNLIKALELMDFAKFDNSENKAFQKEFDRTREKLRALLIHLG